MREIHTMIVWSNASQISRDVEEKLKSNFNLISQFEVCWQKEKFLDNLKVFYSHSQKHRTEDDYERLLVKKMEHCGDKPFSLFVYEDVNPTYDFRLTSSGNRSVNINVFDCKKILREDTGGGHKIHASDNTFESNKDLTLLLGLNLKDFLNQKLESNQNIKVIRNNCIGVDGYKNIEQFFYVLNNSISYCVIRNFECLPKEYTINGHGDIDLLVEDLNYIKYLTLAESYYPDLDFRVHYGINISNVLVPFDFRFVGDDYYDINWQNQILSNLVYFNSIVKVPDTINYFYSLLYHAYVQKSIVKPDYFERLISMSKALKVNYSDSFSLDKIKVILDEYLLKNNFSYTIPKDKTVYFNEFFLNFDASRIDKFGKLISAQQANLNNDILFTEVYDGGTEVVKFGSQLIIENEIKFLTILKDTNWTPKIHSVNLEPNNYFVIIEKLKGVQLNDALVNPLFWKKKNINSFLSQCLEFNRVLVEHCILHRDIRPENILVDFNEKQEIKIKLIDFGWASLISDIKITSNPLGLGGKYKYSEGQYSDLYSTGKIINYIFKQFQFVTDLKYDIEPNEYDDIETLKLKFVNITASTLNKKAHFSFRDKLILWGNSDSLVFKFLIKIKRLLKIKMSK